MLVSDIDKTSRFDMSDKDKEAGSAIPLKTFMVTSPSKVSGVKKVHGSTIPKHSTIQDTPPCGENDDKASTTSYFQASGGSGGDDSSLSKQESPFHYRPSTSGGASSHQIVSNTSIVRERNTGSRKLDGDTSLAQESSQSPKLSSDDMSILQGKHGIRRESGGNTSSVLGSSSSRRPSGGNTSLEGIRSLTSQSEIRQRLAEHLQSVREQAKSQSMDTYKQSRLRSRLLNQPELPRFEEMLRKEEEMVEAALKKHKHKQDQRKNAPEAVKNLPNIKECYDFFTQTWPQDEEMLLPMPSTSSVAAHSEIEEGGDEENSRILSSELLDIEEEVDLLETVLPECEPTEIRLAREKDLYFIPTTTYIPVEERLGPDHVPRYEEDEGLYVGDRPFISLVNRRRMIHRLLMSGNRNWFGDDGEIQSLPDPRRPVIYRSLIFEEVNPLLRTEYKHATIIDPSTMIITRSCDYDDNTCVLELEFISVLFTHHPLFSKEHVLTQRLFELYTTYDYRLEHNLEERLAIRLEALRRARDRLRELEEQNPNLTTEQRTRLEGYLAEIKEVRKLYNEESHRSRVLLLNILHLWRDVKKLRMKQGYSNTPWHLHIIAQPSQDLAAEQQAWDNMIQSEWLEVQEEYTQEYNDCMVEYSKRLALWKKKQKFLERKHLGAEQYSEDDVDNKSEEIKTVKELGPQPEAPIPVDFPALHAAMMTSMSKFFRPPGEPKFTLKLSCSGKVDPNPPCPLEMERRAAVNRSYISARISYNDEVVCVLRAKQLGPEFNPVWGELLTIHVSKWPKSLKVEIYQGGRFFKINRVAELFIPIPSSSTTLETAQQINYEFSNDQVVTHDHGGVGSGIYIKVFPGYSEPSCLNTSGLLTCRLGWGISKLDGTILAPPDRKLRESFRSVRTIKPDELILLDSPDGVPNSALVAWAKKEGMDPNEPSNAVFLSNVKNSCISNPVGRNCFRLDPYGSEFDFCSEGDLRNNTRFCILHLRDQGEPEFRGMQSVPLWEKEIPRNAMQAYNERQAASFLNVEETSPNPLDLHRAWGHHVMNEVRQRVLKICRLAQQHRQLQDIITEEQVPDIGTLGLTFVKCFQPKRPLRPLRKERKKVAIQSLSGQEVKIVVNVVRAFDVPVRKDNDALGDQSVVQTHKFTHVPVLPFVEVSFQGVTVRTTTAEGANPTWNQDLQLPLRSPSGDFTPGSLLNVQDILYFHLFDETIIDLLEDDRERETNIHQRLERHWLGSLYIPFTTLYHNIRIEGTFKLYSPPVLLGYEQEPSHRQFHASPNDIQSPSHRDATFLTLFITVLPALNPPEPFKGELESSEPEYIQEHLKLWEARVLSLFPHRSPKALVINVSGKSMCVTRYIRPLAPPELVKGQPTTPQMAARFVSMIPMVSGSVLFPGLFDVWLSCDQVLNLLSGDLEDHAVLLCCYLLHQGRHAWLLLGAGILHGPSAFVLEQRKGGRFWLWDPSSGQRYDVRDSLCPLQKVYSLINNKNIWANIQADERPGRIQYDLSNVAEWLPAFQRNVIFGPIISPPMNSVQPSVLDYRPTHKPSVSQLQEKIEKHIRDSLMRWRRTARTPWNRYCGTILRKILPVLEKDTWSEGRSANDDHLQELQHVLSTHKMCGFPINLPYTNLEAITETIRATGVHFCENPNVEFALAVYIHPYPNNVLSVWVYVASLVRRK